jgi:hypothetical protein
VPRTRTAVLAVAGLLLAALIFATSRPAPSATAAREVHTFFAALATGRLKAACTRMAPSARRPLTTHGGCVQELRVLRGALMGAPGSPEILTPAAFLSRMDSATNVQSLSADGTGAQVLVPPCLNAFVVTRGVGHQL